MSEHNEARAWHEGYQRGLLDAEQDVQHGADNPYLHLLSGDTHPPMNSVTAALYGDCREAYESAHLAARLERERAERAELKVEQLEGDVIEEENRANENATLVHEARAERDARIVVLDCNAADLHEDAHVWSLDGHESLVCRGRGRGESVTSDDEVKRC